MTQLLYAVGGPAWGQWQPAMDQYLRSSQAVGGHVDGSWYWNSSAQNPQGGGQGGWGDAPWNQHGGRLYCTTLSLLCMEQNFSRLRLGGATGGGNIHAPVSVYAGENRAIGTPNSATLNGVTWGGSGDVEVTWSKVSGPGTVTFGDPTSLQTTAAFSALGTYVLRLSGTDGSSSGTSDVTIYYLADTQAQFVRIRKSSGGNYLSLLEIEIVDAATDANVAGGGTASQNSTAAGRVAERAIDANQTTFTQTAAANLPPWWVADLGAKYTLSKIIVRQRSDCCWDWLEGTTVETFADDPIANPSQTPLFSTVISGTSQGGTLTFMLPQ